MTKKSSRKASKARRAAATPVPASYRYVLPKHPAATNGRIVLDPPGKPRISLKLIRRAVAKVSGTAD